MPILSLDALIARFPYLNEHTVAPPALRQIDNASDLERDLSQLCRLPAASSRTFAALGNVLVRRGAYVDALEAYRTAANLDRTDASAHLMCAEIANVLGDIETSEAFRSQALALQRVFLDPLPVGDRAVVLLLLRDLPYSSNTPLELILDRDRVAVHKYYLESDEPVELPEHGVIFTGFTGARTATHAIERALALGAGATINDPRRLSAIARESLAHTLSGIDGVTSTQADIVPASAVHELETPMLVRPVDTHAGEGLVYAVDADDVVRLLERHPAAEYYRAPFSEYRSEDGFYRKFRIIFVEGRAYQYHLAISPHWMVHYQTAPMESCASLRAQEEAFMASPQTFVPQYDERMRAIAAAVGLDYFGIDATVLPDGRVFVFEADAAMLVHDEDAHGVFAYKRPYVARIREALHALIANHMRRETP